MLIRAESLFSTTTAGDMEATALVWTVSPIPLGKNPNLLRLSEAFWPVWGTYGESESCFQRSGSYYRLLTLLLIRAESLFSTTAAGARQESIPTYAGSLTESTMYSSFLHIAGSLLQEWRALVKIWII